MHSYYNLKTVKRIVTPKEQAEGVGAKTKRVIGANAIKQREMDPFLMLDYFSVKLPAGFPDHPHRGFEVVTYMIKGKMYHEDFKGHKGALSPGDVQWMTAGKGIMHAEIPASKTEPAIGFQLWINLKKEDKKIEPAYQELKKEEIPCVDKWDDEGIIARVIAGESFDVKGPIYTRTPAEYIDFEVKKGSIYRHTVPAKWNILVFAFEGKFEITQDDGKAKKLGKESAAFMEISDSDEILEFKGLGDNNRLMLLAGLPLKEPIAAYGPFVMNTEEEISETFSDYQNSENGFEEGETWESEIKNLMDL